MYTFLIIDDEPIMRAGIRAVLTKSALPISTILEASDGLEALDLLHSKQVHILILDIRMPRMDGLELSGRVSAAYPDIAIIIITGYDDFEYAQQALRHGVKDYLLKPLNSDELIKAVSRILEAYEKRSPPVYILHDKVTFIIQLLVDGIWNMEPQKLNEAKLLMSKLLEDIPPYYGKSVIDDVLNVLLNTLSEKLKYSLNLTLPAYHGSSANELYIWFAHCVEFIKNDISDRRTNADFLLMQKAKKMIEENYNHDDMSLEYISHRIGLTPFYFSRLFKLREGKNFVRFLSEIRMKKAMELLGHPDKSITEITFEVGYSDVTHFIRTFKKYTNLSPKEYRKKRGVDNETSF